jgi:predicted transcriptional regulator of viral defense system
VRIIGTSANADQARAEAEEVHRTSLTFTELGGRLIRVGRGRYVLPQAERSENLGLVLVAAAVPQSVICLLSALRFHGIGTQAPHDVCIAVKQGAARPRLDYPPVRVTFDGMSAAEIIALMESALGLAKSSSIDDLWKPD